MSGDVFEEFISRRPSKSNECPWFENRENYEDFELVFSSASGSRGRSRIFVGGGAPLRNDVTDGEVKNFKSEYVPGDLVT